MEQLIALYDLAEQEGITVDSLGLPKTESMSYMDSAGGCHVGIDPAFIHTKNDELLKLSHELGHCMTGSFYNIYATCDIRGKHENRANRWVYRKLIPIDQLVLAVLNGYTEAWELAEYFSVPVPFLCAAVEYYKMVYAK